MAIRYQPGAPNHQFQIPHWAGNQQQGALAGSEWMPKPPSNSDVPQGLEYLALVDRILIKQKREMMEIVFGWERNNRYFIMNGVGQQIYYAFESTDACSRQCCGQQRAFCIHLVDNFNHEVMRISREFNCCGGSFPCCAEQGSCCAHMVCVEAPPGNVIGYISHRPSCACVNAYEVYDHTEQTVLTIDSPDCCIMSFGCGDKVFNVYSMERYEIGSVRKRWTGILQESFTDADNFGVNFPLDLPVRLKAILIGATFLIDFDNFENR